jgi:integrase
MRVLIKCVQVPNVNIHEIEQLFQQLDASYPVFALFAKPLYGTGMRIMEVARLRTKDIDFEHGRLIS